MNLLPTIERLTEDQLIREMRPIDILDLVFLAYVRFSHQPTKPNCEEYNRWVEVYNFKRGKKVLKHKHYYAPKRGKPVSHR